MKFRHVISTAAIALLPVLAGATTFVVPAAGTGPGANGSQWQSELTIHNAAPRAATLSVSFHQGTTVSGPVELTLQKGQTTSIADVVRTKFDVTSGTGALVIDMQDRDARSIAISSRTSNVTATAEFGQDVPAVDTFNALRAGDIAALSGPSKIADHRFNFGIYAVADSTVTWEVLRADGTVAGSKSVDYLAGQHVQYGSGIEFFLGLTSADNDTIHAHVTSGKAIFYGSIINATGDPTFVPGVRTRDDIVIQFAGVDLDENGSVDIADANGDGVLDAPVVITTSLYPEYLRLVAAGEFGEDVTYEVVSSPATKTDLLDAHGTLRVIAAGDLKNTTGEVQVKISSGTSSTIVTIPVRFQ